MSAQKSLYRQYRLLIDHWPKDPLRPNLSFQNFLRSRTDHEFSVAVEPDSTITTQNPPSHPTTGNPVDAGRPVVKFDQAASGRQLNALQSLLENRYKNKYSVTDHIMKPKANPDYYRDLLVELEAAPHRSWWERMLNSWKGWIRMK